MKKSKFFLLKNCAGIFTGEGYETKRGRRVVKGDSGFLKGPLDIEIDIDKGVIHSIKKSSASNSSHEEFDASSLYVTSAFYDSHTHALYSGTRANEYFQRWSGRSYVDISKAGGGIHNTMSATLEAIAINNFSFINEFENRLKKIYRSGTCVLEIKSGYSPTPEGEIQSLEFLKSFVNCRPQNGLPEIFSTFLPLHALPKGQLEQNYVDSMVALIPNIQKNGLAQFVDAFPEKGFLSLESAIKLFEASKKIGLKIKVHADELSDMNAVDTFCKMGALSVDHLQKISNKGISTLTESKTVGTILPATSFFSNIPYVDARKLLDAGVQVALATDFNPGTAPESSMNFCQRLCASQLKMSAEEIWCASTFNGAAALGLANDSGIVGIGKKSRLCLWKPQTKKSEEILEEIIVDGLSPEVVCNPIP